MARAGTKKTAGTTVPGYQVELGSRISSVIERIGTLAEAGRIAGVTYEQISAWRDGRSKMSFHGATKLCQAVGVSLDWLATGEGSEEPSNKAVLFDKEHLIAAIQSVEELEESRNLKFTPDKKTELILITYEAIIDEE